MQNLELVELKTINGGAIRAGVATIIVGVGVFLIGVLDGMLRPLKTLKAN